MSKRAIYFWSITLVIIGILTLPRILGILAPEQPQKYSLHVVRKGDTIDGLSKRYMPQTESRAAKYFIKRANGMNDNYNIQPGDLLSVPDPDGELEEPLGEVYTSAKAAREVSMEAERVAREAQRTASRSGKPREVVLEITAYTANDPGMDGRGIMFTGLPVDRAALALDTGGAIKGNKADLFITDRKEALEWGRRHVRVRVIQ